MRVLVWQWGRRGGGPRFAVELADALRLVPGVSAKLSLSDRAEILRGPDAPACDLPVATYQSVGGLIWRLLLAPVFVPSLYFRLRALRPDVAICAMPGPLDLLMVLALRWAGVRFLVAIHDADAHPGDGSRLLMWLQRCLTGHADGLITLSQHVAARLREQGFARGSVPLFAFRHPPRAFGDVPPPLGHGGRVRLLFFGRLLPYKGLDLLAEALRRLGPRADLEVRVVGSGPESETLAALRALPDVAVENRWVPEDEIGVVIGWSDVLVLPYREASQSGAAATAIATGRWVISTRVGGLVEQLQHEPRATLCAPDAASLAACLRQFLDAPPPVLSGRADPAIAWRELAETLVRNIETELPARRSKSARCWRS
jgi:glycosyltransferase involved in cell wall biosynthesis